MAAGKNRSTLLIVGAVVVVVVVAGIMLSGNFGSMFSMNYGTQTAAQTQGSTQQETSTSSGTTSPTQNIGVTATATAETTVASAPAPKTVEVDFKDASGFGPSPVTINKGDTVNFVNMGTEAIRVASNPHPIHTGYPTTGGCVGSTFDSCDNISPGGNWSFTFTQVGTWGYHDHLNPGITGTVVVQ